MAYVLEEVLVILPSVLKALMALSTLTDLGHNIPRFLLQPQIHLVCRYSQWIYSFLVCVLPILSEPTWRVKDGKTDIYCTQLKVTHSFLNYLLTTLGWLESFSRLYFEKQRPLRISCKHVQVWTISIICISKGSVGDGRTKTYLICVPYFPFFCLLLPSDTFLVIVRIHLLSFPVCWVIGTFLPVTFETFLLFLGNKPQ